jgi:hypothetical protein
MPPHIWAASCSTFEMPKVENQGSNGLVIYSSNHIIPKKISFCKAKSIYIYIDIVSMTTMISEMHT